jgi:hypothetical protein
MAKPVPLLNRLPDLEIAGNGNPSDESWVVTPESFQSAILYLTVPSSRLSWYWRFSC